MLRTFLALVGLAGCAATAHEPPPPPVLPPAPLALAQPTEAVAAPPKVVVVVRQFDAVRRKEITVAVNASSEQIAAIRAADAKARDALTAMGRQGGQVTPAMLHDAREAVRGLEEALDPS
jgi:hypothetical protein